VVVESGWDEPDVSPNGVAYMNIQAADAPRTADLVIISRAQQWLPAFNAKMKLFWSHDLMNFETAPKTPTDCDYIVALSRYHAQCFPQQRLIIMPNGIDLDLFKDISYGKLEDRQVGKLAYTSNFDRGLPIAIDILHQWRKQYPHLELHVYGGMAVYGWGDQRQRLYVPDNTEGVVFHGALPKAELAKELGTCWAWFYPTFWPETFCISALEAQAAGTPCITVPVGALPETVTAQPPSFDLETTLTNLMHDPTWIGSSKKAAYFGRDLTWTSAAEGLIHAVSGH
jgi:glycosyltransferase involved in cell wall biosynthesis